LKLPLKGALQSNTSSKGATKKRRKDMELAIQIIADLIEHMKKESQDQEIGFFYCGGLHKTADCCSETQFSRFKQEKLDICLS
jgi:hypothetical protein